MAQPCVMFLHLHDLLTQASFLSFSLFQDIKAFDSSHSRFKTLEELFPPATSVFMVGSPYYGAMGEVCITSWFLSTSWLAQRRTTSVYIQSQNPHSLLFPIGHTGAGVQ